MTVEADILRLPHALDREVEAVRCAHCEQIVPAGLVERDAPRQFCCAGCRAVYETIHACGLDSYYRLREAADAAPRPARVSDDGFASFDDPAFHKLYVQQRDDGSAVIDLMLEGVSCAACVWLVERLPGVLDGVIEARLSLREATVRVTWDAARVPLSRIATTLDRLGYTPHPARGQDAREVHQRESRKRLIHLGIAGAIMGNTMLLGLALYAGDHGTMEAQYRMFFRWISAILGTVSLAWPGAVFFRSAIAAIHARTTNLDIPIALALLAGGVAGLVNVILNRGEIYFDSLAVLVFLLLVGRFIQYRQQRRADDAVGLLFSLTPRNCRIVKSAGSGQQAAGSTYSFLPAASCPLPADRVIDAPIEALEIDDLVEVRPGELFPADGVVEKGSTSVNAALLTGESMPSAAEVGSTVHAGAQNVASTVRVRVTSVGRDTRVAQLMQLIERGLRDKPAIVQFADKVGGWFIIAVSIAAAIVFAYWSRFSVSAAIDHTIALLIVTCPCVLGLATPLTIAIAIGKLARRDVLVKSGAALERLARGGEIFLDKTGTLTQGGLTLVEWTGDESIQDAVAALEKRSNHPVGRAIFAALGDTPGTLEAENVVECGDGGISGVVGNRRIHVGSHRYMRQHEIDTRDAAANLVLVAVDRQMVAAARMEDAIRSDSADAVRALAGLGFEASILSGDSQQVVSRVAGDVGIDPRRATGAMSPEEKLAVVAERKSRRTRVMVGDGVNDSAALAAADVGIAVHGGAESSLAAADIYIARPGLAPLVDLLRTSRATMRIVRANLAISLAYNLLAGALAASGAMTPLIAAIIMPLSSVSVLSLAVASIQRAGGNKPWK